MIITIPFIQEKFKKFNSDIFNGALPLVPFYLTNARTFAGKCTFHIKRDILGREKFYNFALRFSVRIDMPEREWEDVIIHEMIHYYIGFRHIKDTSSHGEVFRKLMGEINDRFHRNITISHRRNSAGSKMVPEKRIQYRVVARVELNDGTWAFKVLPRTQRGIMSFYSKVSSSPSVKEVTLFWSKDPYFSNFPCSAAPRVHILELAELEEHMEGAEPMSIKDFT
jgi:hypothetical protein